MNEEFEAVLFMCMAHVIEKFYKCDPAVVLYVMKGTRWFPMLANEN